MSRPSPLGVALLGSGIIAITYGLARFVFGLLLPSIREEMAFGETAAGVIGALPFVSFIVGILAGPRFADRVGVRWAATGAAGLAVLGLALIAGAPSALVLGLGVTICGLSTGLSSPVMAEAVYRHVPAAVRGRANATVNAGTSFGIALAIPFVLLWESSWRSVYQGFAAVAVLGAVAALLYLPPRRARPPRAPAGDQEAAAVHGRLGGIARLTALAGTMGFVSAVYWVFAPDFAVNGGGLSPGQSAAMWLAVGLVGLAGGSAGDLISYEGPGRTHAMALAVMSASLLLLAIGPGNPVLAVISAGVFGTGYMTLTGFYLVRSVEIMADRPAVGPVPPLIATSCGQVAGSAVAGAAIESFGYVGVFCTFAAIGLAVAAISLRLAASPP